MKNVIEVRNVKKYFKEVKAVDNISFDVKEGEFFAFLGVNGAGKSTTINMISGVLNIDEGTIKVNDKDVKNQRMEIKNDIGIVFQFSALDKFLSPYDNLYYRGRLYGIESNELKSRIKALAKTLEFEDFIKRPLNKLSGGQKRKIDIARALIHKPSIIILDEPTTGLDPQTRKLIWNNLNKLRKEEGLTVFLTTHYMEEASEADYVIIIDEGKIIVHGTPSSLKENYASDYIKLYKKELDESSFNKVIKEEKLEIQDERDFYLISIDDVSKAKELIIKYPTLFIDFEVYKGDMDDVFLKVTGKKIGD